MTSVEMTTQNTVENTSTENTSTENVMVGGGKKSIFELYTTWIKKYKFSLFAFVTILSIYIAHTQESFIKVANMVKQINY
tara:strand:- start:903 stop:1142 length:240 start_codon:yes stop_codon:yes gene_type:complete